MERAVTNSRSRLVTITPAPEGWRVGGIDEAATPRPARSMEEAAAAVPAGASVRLSLPVSAVLIERMKLPSTNHEELGGMVVLQLEKTLPYGGEEMTSGFEIIQQVANESDLLAVAVSNEQLDGLCEPLRGRRTLPDQVGIFAIQLAARFPGEQVLALIFREADSTILAIAERGKLVAAHACPSTGRDEFLAELPRMLLAAELEGAPVNFTRLAIERDLADWLDGLRPAFGNLPYVLVPTDAPLEPGPLNLVPAGWTLEQQTEARRAKVRDWIILAGLVYLFLLLAAAIYIIWLQREVGSIDAKVIAATPTVDEIGRERAHWTAVQPAIDPTRYTVEILQQVNKSIPSDQLHITMFEQKPDSFSVEGEAPNGDMANQYMEALKANPDLGAFHFDAPPPEFVSGHAHFKIYANL